MECKFDEKVPTRRVKSARRVVDEEGHDEEGSARRGGSDEKIYPTRSSTDEEDARRRELMKLVDIEAGITICLTSTCLYHNRLCYL
jgi:hypothetical protein